VTILKIPKLKHLETYDIVWIDNNVLLRTGWVEQDDCKDYVNDHSTALIHSAGILYAQDKTFITLIQTHDIGENPSIMNAIKISVKDIQHIGYCKSKKIYEVKK
jgi:hypothetical protein